MHLSALYSCCVIATNMFWYLADSLSLSSSPFMLALFTIWARIGGSSPSSANRPCKTSIIYVLSKLPCYRMDSTTCKLTRTVKTNVHS